MTDRIDLDGLDDGTESETDDGNRGDWLWREESGAEPPDEPAAADATPGGEADRASPPGETETADAETTAADAARERRGDTVPHVPRADRDRPVGIPKESGGAGGATAKAQSDEAADPPGADGAEAEESAAGPHGGGADDMTMALTYRAARELANPAAVFADAAAWADWVGIVGEVEAHVVNKFQRDHRIDADFFNGSGTGPGERLAGIDHHSMFYAERMVVVGLEGDEWIAEAADWEFVPLSEAAEKADWELDGG